MRCDSQSRAFVSSGMDPDNCHNYGMSLLEKSVGAWTMERFSNFRDELTEGWIIAIGYKRNIGRVQDK